MKIEETQESDFLQVVDLVKRVVDKDILPHFSDEGQALFSSKVQSDVETTFDNSKFQNLKLIENNKVIGFAALRENNCITHLFIDTNFQNKGLGKLLLDKLLSLTECSEVRLRASVNAQNFYKSQGLLPQKVCKMLMVSGLFRCDLFAHNKQFKSDSARVAFLACGNFWC
ncbi:TPA: GNAT family N-acetyltransferase [Vibrio parahaemolyticus]|uniref:GNAT family N-acetyltransferase n=1 Tax=Vibrio parahaemolyticus TaxID=670 RepID=UPI0027E553B3|nr:GNAT family N-acetyltransferase [Vibrio parahaemolyticus]